MSLTTLAMIAGVAAGPYHTYTTSDGQRFGFDPGATRKPIDQRGTESALAVRIGGLRPHVETREAIRFPAPSSISRMDAMRAELPDTFEDWTNEHWLMAYNIQWLRDHLGRRNRQRDARRIRMAAMRRRGWR